MHGTADTILPRPDLSDSSVIALKAGIRPLRRGCVRIERETIAGKQVIHNYGHGGAGWTLAPGSAEIACELAAEAAPRGSEIAVIGAGVIGLTTAIRLRRAGFGVRIFAERFTPGTTSDVAGALWAPSLVQRGREEARARFDRALRRSFEHYSSLVGDEWGVRRRSNFSSSKISGGLLRVPRDLVPEGRRLDRFPIEGVATGGWRYETLFIETPIAMRRLMSEADELGIERETRVFGTRDEFADVPASVIVCCVGIGARELLDDEAMLPVRGQIVLLEPQDLPYLLSHAGYMFPRADGVVLGGTFERYVTDPTPQDRDCRRILEQHRGFYT